MSEKYSVHDYTVEQILNFIKSNEIAIPEIQRPFVWNWYLNIVFHHMTVRIFLYRNIWKHRLIS